MPDQPNQDEHQAEASRLAMLSKEDQRAAVADPYREEAERLRLLNVETQRDIVAMHRHVARNPKVSQADRRGAKARADALQRLLALPARPSV
jgi:hypothetical protein